MGGGGGGGGFKPIELPAGYRPVFLGHYLLIISFSSDGFVVGSIV